MLINRELALKFVVPLILINMFNETVIKSNLTFFICIVKVT